MAIAGTELQGHDWKQIRTRFVGFLVNNSGVPDDNSQQVILRMRRRTPDEPQGFLHQLRHTAPDDGVRLKALLDEWLDRVIHTETRRLEARLQADKAFDVQQTSTLVAIKMVVFVRSLVERGDIVGEGRQVYSTFRWLITRAAPNPAQCKTQFRNKMYRLASLIRYKYDAHQLSGYVGRPISETYMQSLALVEELNRLFETLLRDPRANDAILAQLAETVGLERWELGKWSNRPLVLLRGESLLKPGRRPVLPGGKFSNIDKPEKVAERLRFIEESRLEVSLDDCWSDAYRHRLEGEMTQAAMEENPIDFETSEEYGDDADIYWEEMEAGR